MDQILSAISAFFLGVLALFHLGGTPAEQPPPHVPTVVVSQTPSDVQKVIYKGTSPCADCSGIDITLTLNYDGTDNVSGTYTQRYSYQGKPQGNYTETGTWTGNHPNDVIELTPSGGSQKQYYQQATIPTLVALDSKMQKIPPPGGYTLTAN